MTPHARKFNEAAATTTIAAATERDISFVLILHKTLWNLSGWNTIGHSGIQWKLIEFASLVAWDSIDTNNFTTWIMGHTGIPLDGHANHPNYPGKVVGISHGPHLGKPNLGQPCRCAWRHRRSRHCQPIGAR